MSYIDSKGREWFYSLIKKEGHKCLLDKIPRESIINSNRLITQLINKSNNHLYSCFQDYLEFNKYQLSIDEKNRCFFETIFGDKPQKFYLDIDINDNISLHEEIKNEIIKALILTLNEFEIGVDINKDIIVCTSHSSDSEESKIKRSYHVILDNYVFDNSNQTKNMCLIVRDKVKDEYKKYIDASLYKSIQQFRILGSRKRNTERVKIFCNEWSFYNTKIIYEYPQILRGDKYLYQLERTLICNTTGCKKISFEDSLDTQYIKVKTYAKSNEELPEGLAKLAFNKLGEYAGLSVNDPLFPYIFKGVNDSIICLKRVRPSRCKICETIHENEHPFMFIKSNGDIHFDCRRSEGHGDLTHRTLCIGNVYNQMMEYKIGISGIIEGDGEDIEYEDLSNALAKLDHLESDDEISNKDEISDIEIISSINTNPHALNLVQGIHKEDEYLIQSIEVMGKTITKRKKIKKEIIQTNKFYEGYSDQFTQIDKIAKTNKIAKTSKMNKK